MSSQKPKGKIGPVIKNESKLDDAELKCGVHPRNAAFVAAVLHLVRITFDLNIQLSCDKASVKKYMIMRLYSHNIHSYECTSMVNINVADLCQCLANPTSISANVLHTLQSTSHNKQVIPSLFTVYCVI